METTKLSSKGQVILPKAMRDAHKWASGTVFAVEDMGEGVLLRPVNTFKRTEFADVYGCLKYDGPPKTLKQMDDAIIKEVKARHAHGRY